jgi:nucleotide-binding universal stress UspA family protein
MTTDPTAHHDEPSGDHAAEIPPDAVVVGLDGSERDDTCLTWAAGAATRAGKPLHLLHARDTAAELAATDPLAARSVAALLEPADDEILSAAVERARRQWPDLAITSSEPWSHPERALIEASHGAHLVVVGSRKLSGFQRLLLGRSALAVALHARCPVVLLPEGARTDAEGPVVVGVDGSDSSQRAAERAFWIARVRKTPVRVVSSWYLEVVDGTVVTTPDTPAWDEVVERVHARVEEQIAPVHAAYPEVPYEVAAVRGRPAEVLTDESAHASLLVLGSRGRGGFRGMMLGSVSHKVIESAGCPVMVVRHG